MRMGRRALAAPPRSQALQKRLAPPARRWTRIRQDGVRRRISNEVAPAVTRGRSSASP